MFIQDPLVVVLFFFAAVVLLAAYGALIVFVAPRPEPMIIHYSIYFGIDLIGQWYELYAMPVVGTFLWLVNGSLLLLVYKQLRVVAYFLATTSSAVSVLVLIATSLLIWVNG